MTLLLLKKYIVLNQKSNIMGELLNKGNTKKTNKEDIAKKWSELGFLDGLKPMGDKEKQRITFKRSKNNRILYRRILLY